MGHIFPEKLERTGCLTISAGEIHKTGIQLYFAVTVLLPIWAVPAMLSPYLLKAK
jgi:hypothetical protein